MLPPGDQPKSGDIPSNPPFPVPNATVPFWRTDLDEIDSVCTTEALPEDCDVCIIGSGISGASTAYHLLNGNGNNENLRVVMLEARQVCSGATGRNGGHTKMLWPYIATISKKHDLQEAIEVTAFQAANLHAIKHVTEKENIDCDLVLTRSLDVFCNQTQAEELRAEFRAQQNADLEIIKDVDFISEKYGERLTSIKGAKGAYSTTAVSLWPYKLVVGLLKIALTKGLNLQTHTMVTSVQPSANGLHSVSTSRGPIQARKIVFASDGFTSGILPQYARAITPIRGINSRITVPDGAIAPLLSNTYGIRGPSTEYEYLIPRPDGSIILGGGGHLFREDRAKWYNVFDDSVVIEPVRSYFDRYMQTHFHGWEDSEAKTERVWSGIMGYTSDNMPHIGAVPGAENQYIVAGFNGRGMSEAFLSGKGVAKMVRDGAAFEGTGVPKIFKTTQERLDDDEDRVKTV